MGPKEKVGGESVSLFFRERERELSVKASSSYQLRIFRKESFTRLVLFSITGFFWCMVYVPDRSGFQLREVVLFSGKR